MRRFAPPVPRWSSFAVCLAVVLISGSTPSAQQTTTPIADPNVNMVRGITLPTGDPFMQRQNEPSIAVSTRNPCHLVAGANDYRSVDIPFDNTPPPNGESSISLAGDAWLGLFKSFDCGQKWSSTLLPGFPQDNSTVGLPLKGYEAGADPTVRAGSNGLFYYSGMVFNRGLQGLSKIFVARLIDNNNKERGDPIQFIDISTIDTGGKGQFLDKPWLAVDIPRSSFGPGATLGPSSAMCDVAGQRIPAGNVYMAWARFTGDSHDHSKLMFAKSADCGKTWKTFPLSNNQTISQGANLAIAPHDGTIYLTWREFAAAGSPVNMWIAVSSDGGETFSKPTLVAQNLKPFDQFRTTTKFRSNALPAITADHQNRVYVAWSETGYFSAPDANGIIHNYARVVVAVSSDRGKTFLTRYPIDPVNVRGHQMMPSLAYAAGKIQAIYYDSREDASGVFNNFIDDKDVALGRLRHTIDVRGVQADPAAQPVFVAGGLSSLEISKYRQWSVETTDAGGNVERTSIEIGANPPNLQMYAAGTTPFIGDYIDVSALSAFPIQTTGGQVWQPNIGPINLLGASASGIMANGFPTLPIFHATWTDNRDVQVVSQVCTVPPADSARGDRNANIYTARLTPGLFVGSPGNTKPLGFRIDPETGKPTTQLMQRGFVVFAQNTTDVLKFYEFHITNQPAGGKATFRQFEKPEQTAATKIVVSIPKQSTVARTVYATSTDVNAQILVNVQEVTPIEKPGTAVGQPDPNEKKEYDWVPVTNGLRASILLNPDRTNPPIVDPDIDGDIPEIATTEVHNPSMFDAQFFRHRPGTSSRQLDVKNPDPESPDPESPDPESPDPESPDPESPDPESDPENPDPESPDPESPDPESPDFESPDMESAALLNTAISEEDVQNSTITDINWRVHNSGNTTSAYRFRPVLQETGSNTKYQLIVTRRYMTLTMDTVLDKATNTFVCKPVYKSQNHVVVNIVNFDPKAPDLESPDLESPDPESPDLESPDPESPDPESANFFLAPEETATVTLRVFTPPSEDAPTSEDEGVAARASAEAANTGETVVSEVVRGAADLTLHDESYVVAPAVLRPGHTANVTWTLSNRGSADAIADSGSIKTRVYLSTNNSILDQVDQLIATVQEPTPFKFCPVGDATPECATTATTPVPMPQVPGQYFVIIETDGDAEVFEAELGGEGDGNNLLVIPVNVDAYQLAFVSQPSATTQDYSIAPAVTVAILHPDGGAVSASDVPGVTLSIQTNPSAGTLAGNTTQPNVGGVATFSDARINQVGTGYTLAANAPFSTFAISAPFNIEADAPPDATNDSHTIAEDQVLTVAAPGVLANDTDPPTKGIKPAGYALHAVKQSDPNGGLTFNQDGSFTYTPPNNFTGSTSFTYQARDGRPGNSDPATVTITVSAVNDAPSFTKGADQTVAEDAGLQTVPNWATAISAGPADESGQVVDFIVTNNNNTLFSAQPAISPTGTLTYTTAPNRDGVATVTVQLHDNGCPNNVCASGSVNTSAPQTFTINVTGANDAPVAQADTYTTREDTVLNVNGAGGMQKLLFNDTDADGNTLTAQYLTTTANGVLATLPDGSFTYTPDANFFGTDSFSYRPFDGTTAGNTITVAINVLPVNDVPSFVKGENQLVPMNATTQVFAWAEQLSAGPANESTQALDFIVTNDNAGLFATAPAVSPAGTLSFTPRNNIEGVATVTVRVHDNGTTDNGGVDTSAAQTFVITVTAAVQNYVVTNTNDSGKGSLRLALENANANDSHDVISFNISSGLGVRTITPLTPLPPIVFRVTINATTQPGYSGTPLVELNGASAGANANGFTVMSSNVTIRGFAINRFQNTGISINGSNNVVAGNYIGTNAAGTAALPNGQDGVHLVGAPNLVGGSIASERNVIAGNTRHGVMVSNTSADGNAIRGNYIGTNAAGAAAVGNGQAGVWIEQSGKVTIGGTLAGESNTISGNGANGVHLYICSPPVPCTGATVHGNRIGTNAAGTAAVPNRRHGIEVTNSPNHIIRGNVISGNGTATNNLTGNGIEIIVPTPAVDPLAEQKYGNHVIAGNLIGTNAAGSAAIPNLKIGISLSGSTKARIGGTTAADRNVISFNGDSGVFVGFGPTFNNTLQGNYIGVNAAGTQAAPNQGGGVYVANGSTGNLIGTAGAGNIIGGNLGHGVSIVDTSSNNVVEGNFIGVNADGTVAFGNQHAGVSVDGADNVTTGNRIANNTSGVIVNTNGARNRITQNSMYDNGLLGIDLMPVGVTANDAGDTDNGANRLQNFPVIAAAHNNNSVTTVIGTLNSTPNSSFTIELFSNVAADGSGNGEGRTYLTSAPVTTDAAGNAAFTAALAVAAGHFVTATATDSTGNTSEFSNARLVVVNTAPTTQNDTATTGEDANVAIAVLANDTDPDTDALSVSSIVQPANGVAVVQANGTITYAPNANFFGSDSFTYRALDARGGLSLPATVNVTITAVNDAPSFVKGANQSVTQSAALQTVPNWATAISAGPLESAQTVNFIVTNDNNVLFDVQPAVSPTGTLTFDPATGVAGSAIVSVQLQDNGGITPGVDKSAIETFTITVVSTTAADYIVINTNDSGNGSLRQALLDANTTSFSDVIKFNIAGGGEKVILPLTALPVITGPVFIDGTTQPGYDGKPIIRLHGGNGIANGLETPFDVFGVRVKGLSITGFSNAGLYLLQAELKAGHIIEENVIGTDRNDTAGLGNGTGIVLRADNSTIARNVLSGNSANGIRVENDADNVTISDNKIGTTFSGLNARPNGTGVLAFGTLNNLRIENNVISANTGWGIDFQHVVNDPIVNARIRGNTIGLFADGSSLAGNGSGGVKVDNARGTLIGEADQPPNVISGNGGPGIHLTRTAAPLPMPIVQHNYIGTDSTGMLARGNGLGILVSGTTSQALIGGTSAAARNVISGNIGFGIEVDGSPTTAATTIQGNFIGLAADGTTALGNGAAGIKTTNAAVMVGGTTSGARNVIAGNLNGLSFSNSGTEFNSFVYGNYFGTDVTGSLARGGGIAVSIGSAPGTRVGGDLPGQGNLFAGSTTGVSVSAGSHPRIDNLYNSVIQGNTFGLSATGGALPLGTAIAIGNSFNLIGGTTAAARNIIANSTNAGVVVSAGEQNSILGNSIYDNGSLGIDLNDDGVTPNDDGDGDTGANTKQNFPVITGAITTGEATLIAGSLNSLPNQTYRLELFRSSTADPSGHGEGQQLFSSLDVTTDATGNVTFSDASGVLPAGTVVTATATNSAGNTSEFSAVFMVPANTAPIATADSNYTISGQEATFAPAANDLDPDVASPQIRATYQPTGATPVLTSPGDVAIVSSTGIGYFTGGNLSAATDGKIGILNLATNTVGGAIQMTGNNPASLVRVSQSTRIAYMRTGGFLQAIDGRAESPTFNQSILNVFFGAIQSMVLNESSKRLYATASSTGVALIPNGRVVVIDIDPTSPTFHKVLDQITVPSVNGTVSAIAVNAVTNKVYVGVSGGQAGVWVMDGVSHALAQVTGGFINTPQAIAVNDLDNLIYVIQGSNLHAIDGTTNALITTIPLPASASAGNVDTRIAIHRGNGKVFVRLAEFPNPSRLVVIDGKRTSGTFNQIVSQQPLGRENSQTNVVIDEAVDRLITTSTIDHETHILDTTNHDLLNTIPSTQNAVRASIDLQTHRAYVTGAIGHLQVINLTTAQLMANVQVGVELFGLDVDPLTHSAYLAQTGATTAVVRLNETGVIGSVPLPHADGRDTYLARNPTTNTVYVLNSGALAAGSADALPGFVHVIDGVSNTVTASVPVGAFPFGLAVDHISNKIYVGNGTNGAGVVAGITVINGADNSTAQADLSQIPRVAGFTDVGVGRDLAPNTATGKLYFRITAGSTTQLGVLNGLIGTPLTNFGNVNIIRVNPSLSRVYVGATQPNTFVNQIHVLNGATDQLITSLDVGFPSNFITNQSYLAINTNTGRLYVADFLDHYLAVIDGATNTPVATIPVGRGPGPVAINMAANRIYVGNAVERSLTIIDGATNRVVRTLALPLAPVQITVDDTLAPARLYIQSTASEAKLVVVDDPATAAPVITAITQPANGTAVLNGDGTVTYTPNATFTGTDSYTYTTNDGNGGVTTATAFVAVAPALTITTATVANGMVDVPYSQTFTATGGTGPVSWFLTGALPGGLNITPGGVLTGTPRQAGTFSITLQARDSGTPPQIEQVSYTMLIGPPTIAPGTLNNGTVNVPYTHQLFLGGGVGNVTWLLDTGGHPALTWLSLSNAGVLSGTHTTFGTSPPFTVTAIDSEGQKAQRTYTIFFNAPLDLTPMREGVVLENPPGLPIIGGNGTRTATLTSAPTTLPPGLTLNSNGGFSGQPLRHGTYNFTVELRDCSPASSCAAGTVQQVVTRNVSWRISAREQQGSSQTNPPVGPIAFGGPSGVRLAQVITVGAQGTITAVGIPNNALTCPTQTPLTFEVQRLTLAGIPDGVTVASGTATTAFNQITLNTSVAVSIGTRLAVVVSSPLACSMNSAPAFDFYNGGQGYIDRGAGWLDLFEDSGRYDLTSVRTLIQPAMDVTYMFSAHGGTTATLLTSGPNSGKVLIAGNSNGVTAELFDPETNIATTTGNLTVTRQNATATSLANGSVLIVGGRDNTGIRLASAEIYNPVTGVFTPTAGSLAAPRENHRAVRFVVNGVEKVLITGGQNSTNGNLNTAEVYEPLTGTFSAAPNMLNGRQQHIAVLLDNNKILIAGGYSCCTNVSAELFDPANNVFTATTGAMIVSNRGGGAAAKLFNGTVLVTGGQSGDVRAEAELYDPATDAFTAVGSMLSKRHQHTATLSPDGTVLIAGGFDAQTQASYTLPLATLERYIPGLGFVGAGSMEARRAQHAAVRLSSDKTLLVGGFSQSWMTNNTAELFSPTETLSITPTTLPDGTPGVAYPATVLNASGGTPPRQVAHVAGALPAGMSYTPATQTLAGTPVPGSTGVYMLGFEASDAATNSSTQSFALHIGNVITITSPYGLPNAAMNTQYSVQLTSTGVSPVLWSLAPASSALPAGLTLGSDGAITGTPTQTGFFNFIVRAIGNDGQQALKVLSISVQQPLTITTTSLNNVDLFSGGPGCVSASNGTGTRFWDIAFGGLPQGLSINSSNGCINGSALNTGTFTFTVRVTDQSSPPQVATREFTINSWAMDQNTGNSLNEPPLTFGGTIWIAQRVITGVTGTLRAVRLIGASCPAGTVVTAQIQGVRADGAPDGVVLASGQGSPPFGTIVLSSGVFFAADAQFTLVFSSDQNCTIRPNNFDGYPGTGYVATNITNWQTQLSVDGRPDLPFVTLVHPMFGLMPMSTWRGDHAETRLPNGKVLLTGGNGTNQADLYDPVADSIAPVFNTVTLAIATMASPRSGHTATLLDNGTVLIAGGYDNLGAPLSSAEIYNPAAGTFTAIGSMATARSSHTATKLPDGNVLLAGGSGAGFQNLQSAEIFQSAGNTFMAIGTMLSARNQHTATLLDDGRVLLAGGFSTGFGPNAELYSHGSMTFAPTDGPMVVHRGRHTATLLSDGKVLLAGGTGNGSAQSSAELFEPATGPLLNGTFTGIPSMQTERDDHTAVKLADGSVLVTGGLRDTTCCNIPHEPQATMERYVPGTGWVNAGSMLVSRYNHTATLLSNGRVLLAGTWGWSNSGGRMAEFYDPASALFFVGPTSLTGTTGQSFSHELIPGGGAAPRTVLHISGSLPPGLNLLSSPLRIAGTPTAPGTFTSTFRILDGNGQVLFVTFTIRINPVVIVSTTLPTAFTGVAYSATLTGSGVGGIVNWEIISGNLPNGLALNQATGEIAGTPTVTCCTYFFTVRATDSIGQTGTKTVSINVEQPFTVGADVPQLGIVNESYHYQLTAQNGILPFTWTMDAGTLLPGTVLTQSGAIDGVPTRSGFLNVVVRATDSGNPARTANQSVLDRVLAIDQRAPGEVTANTVAINNGQSVAQTFTARANAPIYAVRAPVTCSSGSTLTITINDVLPDGRPGSSVMASGHFVTPLPVHQKFEFASPLYVMNSARVAAVFAANGSCLLAQPSQSNTYAEGAAFMDAGLGWAALPGFADLRAETLVDLPELNFTSTYRANPQVSLTAAGAVITGGASVATTYNPATGVLTNGTTPILERHEGTATSLPNGRILIVGGIHNGNVTAQAELYNPATGQVQSTSEPMQFARRRHTATLLNDGRVLIAGGLDIGVTGIQTAEIYDPISDSFSSAGNMLTVRYEHQATLLPSGNVLIAAGASNPAQTPYVDAELYVPNTGFVAVFDSMMLQRMHHRAVSLSDGRVLITGGHNINNADLTSSTEIYDEQCDCFTAGPLMTIERQLHSATRLADGRVLIAGGYAGPATDPLATLEIIDVAAGHSTPAGMMDVARTYHAAALLPGGEVVIVGGFIPDAAPHSVELFDPATDLLPDATEGQPYSATIALRSGTPIAFDLLAGSLPNGLTLNFATGEITGTPTATGTAEIMVMISDSSGNRTYENLSLTTR